MRHFKPPTPLFARPGPSLRAVLLVLVGLSLSIPAKADPPRRGPLDEANTTLIRASHASRLMLHLLDETRRSGNEQHSRCVDRALSQINSFSQNLEMRRDRLAEALSRGDRTAAAHEQRRIQAVATQLQSRVNAGRACVVGEVPVGQQVTVVEVVVDATVPRHTDLSADAVRRRR